MTGQSILLIPRPIRRLRLATQFFCDAFRPEKRKIIAPIHRKDDLFRNMHLW